jgi:hypothetical protein
MRVNGSMKIGYDRDADIIVKGFHVGDFVRLVADQGGDLGSGRAGDWGLVTAVDAAGRLTIKRAGYSAPRNATLVSLSAVPPRLVRPCDANGRPKALQAERGRLSAALWGGQWDRRG